MGLVPVLSFSSAMPFADRLKITSEVRIMVAFSKIFIIEFTSGYLFGALSFFCLNPLMRKLRIALDAMDAMDAMGAMDANRI